MPGLELRNKRTSARRKFGFFRRLILLALAVVFIGLAINPILHRTIKRAVGSVTGSETLIGNLQATWRDPSVRLVDVKVGDPYHTEHNLFEAESVSLELDRSALLRRRAVVQRGRIDGLRVGVPRSSVSSVISPQQVTAYQSSVAERFRRLSGGWLETAASRVNSDWPNQIASVQVASQLAEKWPQQHKAVEQTADGLLQRAIAVRKRLEQSGHNRLRNISAYQFAVGEIEALNVEIEDIEQQSSQLQTQLKADRKSFQSASLQDSQLVLQQDDMAEIDGKSLSDYLVGTEVSECLANVLHWVVWSRRLTPTIVDGHELLQRGMNMEFGEAAPAQVEIQSMVLQGVADLGDGDVPLDGTITNWTSKPTVSHAPTEVVVQTGGSTPMLVQAVLDRRGGESLDRIIVNCPRLPRPRRLLGSEDDLSLTASAGDVRVWCHVDVVGDRLSGKLLLNQTQMAYRPHSNLKNPEVSEALEYAVSDLKEFDVTVEIGGTLTTPEWSLVSNIGPHLAARLSESFRAQSANGTRTRINSAQQEAMQQLQAIEQDLVTKQNATMSKLRQTLMEIETLKQSVAGRVRLTDAVLDPGSPLREMYRR